MVIATQNRLIRLEKNSQPAWIGLRKKTFEITMAGFSIISSSLLDIRRRASFLANTAIRVFLCFAIRVFQENFVYNELEYAHINMMNVLRSIQYIYTVLHKFQVRQVHGDFSIVRYIFHIMNKASEMIILELQHSNAPVDGTTTLCQPLGTKNINEERDFFLYDTVYDSSGLYMTWKNRCKQYATVHADTAFFVEEQTTGVSDDTNTAIFQNNNVDENVESNINDYPDIDHGHYTVPI